MVVLLVLMLAQHAVISAKAGLVTYSEGVVSPGASNLIGEGNTLTSGPSGRAEMTLNPDSYLRIQPYSRITLMSEELADIDLVVEYGAAIADIRNLDDDFPIQIRVRDLTAEIRRNGTYLFEPDRIAVLDGELRIGVQETRLREGRALLLTQDSPVEVQLDEDIEGHPLVRWNDYRRELLKPPPPRRRVISPRRFRF